MLYGVTLVSEHRPDPTSPDTGCGLVVRTSSNGRSTEVDVLADDGVVTVTVPAVADEAAAARFAGLFRQVTSVRLDVDGHEVEASVRGVRHRLPVTQPVGLHVALSLAAQGVPALVSWRGR
jgi:hypothetical protein